MTLIPPRRDVEPTRARTGAPPAPRRLATALSLLAAVLAGASVAVLALGPRILDTGDIGWMLHGPLGPDPVAYWLAWTFFRHAPWTLPPGLNPEYGLELASAIFYVDVVPLLALPLKALRDVVRVEQYWGPWLVACGALQAGFAWRLIGLATRDPLARAAGAALFAFQPMMINRMGGHFALVAHFVLIAGLFLCLRDATGRRQGLAWIVLLGAAALINAYLLAMTAALWGADLVARAWREGRIAARAGEAIGVAAAVASGLWLSGFFSLAGPLKPLGPGYGATGLDLLAPFDPVEWGSLLPALPGLRHWEHGGSYLGAGSFLLVGAALVALATARLAWRAALARHALLLAALLAMLAFAVTNRIAIAGEVIAEFPLPATVQHYADLLRASERFVWPLAYATLFAALAAVAARWGARRARLVLLAALALQIADVQGGLARYRALVADAPRAPVERLADPFWGEAARHYQRVRAVPAGNFGAHWEEIARYAALHGLATDSIYHSRVDRTALRRLRMAVIAELDAGRWEPGTLYVLRDEASIAIVAARFDPSRDLLRRVDGLMVFAPGWRAR
ncbi:MAG: hypothetical protein BroJett026_40810 [Betaproteobacteria bacterium]|nr:MAG: hypothetical protein BroJett026_40810 [Betaproteobacteria bacterium]